MSSSRRNLILVSSLALSACANQSCYIDSSSDFYDLNLTEKIFQPTQELVQELKNAVDPSDLGNFERAWQFGDMVLFSALLISVDLQMGLDTLL